MSTHPADGAAAGAVSGPAADVLRRRRVGHIHAPAENGGDGGRV
ncbi:hypothetical protein [Lawsonibacter sp. JLR.KK007]